MPDGRDWRYTRGMRRRQVGQTPRSTGLRKARRGSVRIAQTQLRRFLVSVRPLSAHHPNPKTNRPKNKQPEKLVLAISQKILHDCGKGGAPACGLAGK